MKRVYGFLLAAFGVLLFPGQSVLQAADGPVWRYQLIDGSYILRDCPVCGGPLVRRDLRGGFTLRLVEQNPIMTRFEITDLSFATTSGDPITVVKGTGTYVLSGEVALRQQMVLNTVVNGENHVFTNETTSISRPFPSLLIELLQSEFSLVEVYAMELRAAPFREIWFSVANGFTSGIGAPNGTSGDLLSHLGRKVLSSDELTKDLALQPGPNSLAIDAVDVAGAGEVYFSFREPQFSETLGAIQSGDIVSLGGRRIAMNQALVSAFGLTSNAIDYGLDALAVVNGGELWFSIETDVFSPALGRTLRRGDLLSNRGHVVRTHEQFMAAFHPAVNMDYGLDAVFVWASGEIWFSTELGFEDQNLGSVQPGDLLSGHGYVVYRNLELVNPFGPVEDLSDFGLTSLDVITDVHPPAAAPRFTAIRVGLGGVVVMEWTGSGRAYQVEASRSVAGPYEPLGPIQVRTSFEHRPEPGEASWYYRLRQW